LLKKIYIIGHKANAAGDTIEYLKEGANGLEPEICYVENTMEKFYVCGNLPGEEVGKQELFNRIIHGDIPSLKNYLHTLTDFLRTNPRFRVSMLSLKLVPPCDYNINELYEVIRLNFSRDHPGTVILTTAADAGAIAFFSALERQYPNEAVSIDGNITPKEACEFFSRLKLNYAFGTGTDVPALSSAADTFTDRARIAAGMKETDPAGRLKIVYAWLVNSEQSMKSYLDIGVDAIVTGKPGRLKNLVESQLYRFKYTLADNKDEPFV